jgi:transcriptional regulator with XRE-family HTH domain
MSETNEKEFYRWLGEQYRLYREKKGLKQKEVATKAGIAPGDLSKFENRGKKLSAYRISRLLEAIGLKLEELFQDDDAKKNSLLPLPVTS